MTLSLVLFALAAPNAARAEHGDPSLSSFPRSGEALDRSGTIALLSTNGPHALVHDACAFRYVSGARSIGARTIARGGGTDDEGYGDSFRILRARERLTPGRVYVLEARCAGGTAFRQVEFASDADAPYGFAVSAERSPPPSWRSAEVAPHPDYAGHSALRVVLEAAHPVAALVEVIVDGRRLAILTRAVPEPNAEFDFLLLDAPVAAVEVTPISRSFARGTARRIAVPSSATSASLYVHVQLVAP